MKRTCFDKNKNTDENFKHEVPCLPVGVASGLIKTNYLRMKIQVIFLLLAIINTFSYCSIAQGGKEPWTEKQLMQPAELVKIITDKNSKKPIIFSIGYDAIIKGSIEIGAITKQANLDMLQNELSKLSADANVVIYCGCCPFKNCPNIRPAFELLNKMKFTNAKLLNLSENIKVDWLDKGFPVNERK